MSNNNLYAPWRETYVKKEDDMLNGCVFCYQIDAGEDDTYFIVKRFAHNTVALNLYPYNIGHLLVLPHTHTSSLTDLDEATRAEMMEILTVSTTVLSESLGAESFNVGFNIGQHGGGGIPQHMHGHVVPRWKGDTNFFPVLSGDRVISLDLSKIHQQLKVAFLDIEI